MKGFLHRIFMLVNLIYGCSSDSDNSSISIATDITVIGSKDAIVYQADITNGENVTIYNLTQELGLPDSNIRFYGRDYAPMIYFYHGPTVFQINKTWERNLVNGSNKNYNIPCTASTNSVSNGPVTYGDNVFMIEPKFENNQNLLDITIFNKTTSQCHTINLGPGIIDTGRDVFISSNGYLIAYHVNNLDETVISKINPSTYSIDDQIILNGRGVGLTIDNDKLYFFSFFLEYDYYTYDIDSFQLLDFKNFNTSFPFFIGIREIQFKGSLMPLLVEAAQPSVVSSIPVIYDLNNGSVVKQIDSFLMRSNLQGLDGLESAEINILEFKIDLKNSIVIGGYEMYINPTEKTYGLFFSDFDSNILKTIDLDFQPGDIIIN